MEDMIRLTEEEIAEVMGLPYPLEELEHENYAVVDIYDLHPLVKAQVEKVVEWLNIECEEHDNKERVKLREQMEQFKMSKPYFPRAMCWRCWQSLLEEVK